MNLKRILLKLTSTQKILKILERIIIALLNYVGIGSGAGVNNSGEKVVFELLKRKISPPYCLFDVGSNKGQYLNLSIREMNDQDFNIHCFEPGKETFEILEKATIDKRVKLNNIGLGKQNEEKLLHYNNAGSGLASLTKRRLDHFDIDFGQSETVSIKTLDKYCEENEVKHINLLKIDVEGHELDVFEGASNMFGQDSIDIITFEFGGCNIDTRTFFQDYWYFFLDKGYSIYRVTPSGFLYKIEMYKEIYEQFRTTNYVVISNRL